LINLFLSTPHRASAAHRNMPQHQHGETKHNNV
jgi:hypothetical protein